jgi:hypothetical protein
MKKKGTASNNSIFALWEKASKAKKTDETSTPNQTVAASSSSSGREQLAIGASANTGYRT